MEDLIYVRNYSIWVDLRVLWASLGRLLRGGRSGESLGRWQTLGGPPRPAAERSPAGRDLQAA
jgi:hypothetical protein